MQTSHKPWRFSVGTLAMHVQLAVVALFNAITQQRQAERSGDAPAASMASNSKRKGDGSRAVKDLTKSTFLDMLKSGKSADSKKGATGSSSSSTKSSVVAPPARGSCSIDDDDSAGGAQWSVLKDDYLIGSKNMKDWDKDSDDDASADNSGVRALGEDSGDDE
jgi:Rrp15p